MKNWPKNMNHVTKTGHFNFRSHELVTLEDLGLTTGHHKLRRVIRSFPDTIDAISSGLFQYGTDALPGEGIDGRWSKI